MTKKRFVKLLMSKGYSRNVAMFLADSTDDSYSNKYLVLTDTACFIAKVFDWFLNQVIFEPARSLAELVNVRKPPAIISDNNLHLPAKTYMKGDENRE